MATFDDMMKKLQQDDPEAYAESMKMQEQARAEVERNQQVGRTIVLQVLQIRDKQHFDHYISSLTFSDLEKHLEAFSTNERVLTDQYTKSLGHNVLDSLNDSSQLNADLLNQPYPKDVSALGKLLAVTDTNELYDRVEKLERSQLLEHIKPMRTIRKVFRKAYHEYLDRNIFSVSKNKFNDVLKRTTWEDVRAELLKHYPKEEKMVAADGGYQKVYEELLTMPAHKNEDHTVIHIQVDDGGADVSGIMPNDLQHYALDFSRWEDWLGYYVSQNNIDEFGDATVVAFCLWEMTFVGFQQEEIQDQLGELIERVEDSKRQFSENKEKNE